MSFKVGDTVRLKSGSPLMTVIDVQSADASEPSVACAWFSGEEAAHKGEFPGAALEMEIDSEEEDEDEDEHGDDEEEDGDDEGEEEKEEGKKHKSKKDK
jgi:uncharacterized protein YodC (DUF2158 family)